MFTDLTRARIEVTASSAGGAPFLFAFGLTIFLTGLAALWLPSKTAALILLFQGNAALPLAFWLQRRMAWPSPRWPPATSGRLGAGSATLAGYSALAGGTADQGA